MNKFWEKLDNLINTKKITIDRPKDSRHPKFPESIYPYDYGYLEDIVSSDGVGTDVWVGTEDPKKVTAFISTFDAYKNDMEIKLLIGCSDLEMKKILDFHQKGDMVAHLVVREN